MGRDLTYRSSSLLLSTCVSTISTSPIVLRIFIFVFVKPTRVLKYCIYSYSNGHRGARLSNFLRFKCGVYSKVEFIWKLDATKKCSLSILIISGPRRLFGGGAFLIFSLNATLIWVNTVTLWCSCSQRKHYLRCLADLRLTLHLLVISKCVTVHVTKRVQTWHVLPPNIRSLGWR